MPFTNAPSNDTYSTHRIPLAYGINLRAGSTAIVQDAGMVNVIPFKEKDVSGADVIWGETRYAIAGSLVNNTAGNITRGMYVWEKTAGTVYYFMVVGVKVYTSTNAFSWTNVTTLATNVDTPVRFTEYIDSTNVKKLIMVDGVEGYVFTSNAAGTKIVDVDFPSPHVPFPIYLDGYLFLAKAGTGDIYNSDLNVPDSWTPGNFFSAQGYADDIQALVRINNYLVAIGNSSTEYFYDAGNSPGSPLARLDGATLPFGTLMPNSIATNKDTIIFLSNNGDGEATMRMIEGLKYKEINAKFIISLLNQQFLSLTTYSKVRGYFFRQQGELFYGFSPNGTTTAGAVSSLQLPTFAYSFTNDMWFELVYSNQTIFPVTHTAPATTGSLQTYIAGSFGGLAFFGQWSSTRQGDTLDGTATSQIYQEIRTPLLEFGTMNRKTMSRLTLGYSSASDTEIPATVQWTDDDWISFQTADGTLGTMYTGSGQNGSGSYPSLTRLGMFRRRGFKLYTTSLFQRRWQFLEFDINKLQQ